MIDATVVVECRLPEDTGGRVFQLVDRVPGTEVAEKRDPTSVPDPRWVLILRARPLGQRAIELPMPNARVTRTKDRVTASSRSANGGLTVELDAAATGSTLDVFVNFELEVNVWRDLSPEVERMNTTGPRRDAQCVILPDRAQLP